MEALRTLKVLFFEFWFSGCWGGFGTLKALGRDPERPSWRLLGRPPLHPQKKHHQSKSYGQPSMTFPGKVSTWPVLVKEVRLYHHLSATRSF